MIRSPGRICDPAIIHKLSQGPIGGLVRKVQRAGKIDNGAFKQARHHTGIDPFFCAADAYDLKRLTLRLYLLCRLPRIGACKIRICKGRQDRRFVDLYKRPSLRHDRIAVVSIRKHRCFGKAHPGLGTVDDKSFAIRADTLKMNAPALNNIKAAGPRALTKDRIPCGPRQRKAEGGMRL